MSYYQLSISLCILLLVAGLSSSGYRRAEGLSKYSLEVPFSNRFENTVEENELIRRNPNDAGAYYNRGTVRSQQGDRIGAISDFTQVIRINPNDPNLFYNVAGAYTKRGDQYRIIGDKEKALSDYRKAASIYQRWKDDVRYELILNTIKFMQQQ